MLVRGGTGGGGGGVVQRLGWELGKEVAQISEVPGPASLAELASLPASEIKDGA